jgi:hypothetical protein
MRKIMIKIPHNKSLPWIDVLHICVSSEDKLGIASNRALKSVGKAMASSKSIGVRLCVCPKAAGMASIQVRATL